MYKRGERISFRVLRLMLKSVQRWPVRAVGRWALRANRSAVADVRRLDIIPVRARGARNQLQLSKGHYIGWWCSSSSNSQILVFWCVTRLCSSLACEIRYTKSI
jgi:hypothetical protein